MLLKKLSLTNFRPFKGEHEIEFSTDREKNVTLIMAFNGSGKTTLEKAFQWILYGKTEGFKNKSLLNSIVEKEMPIDSEVNVIGKIEVEHNDTDYTIIRKQVYRKDINGIVKSDNPNLEIFTKQDDGQTFIVNSLKNLSTIANILPDSLSKYFFFDGERMDKMADEVNAGKSEEFKVAVQNILGLTALNKAIEHLNPNQKNTVIGRYNSQMDAAGDQQTRELREIVYNSTDEIEKNNNRINKIEEEISYYQSEIYEAKNKILQYADAEKLQQELNKLNSNLENEQKAKNKMISTLMSNFTNQTYNYMSRKLIQEALIELKNTDNIDKGIPSVRAETIKFLMERKKCLCGTDLSDPTSEAVVNLTELLKYIPPQSLGSAIAQFQEHSSNSIKVSENYYRNIETQISSIRASENRIGDIEHQIGEIDKNILKSKNNEVANLKSRQTTMEKTLKELTAELIDLKGKNANLDEKKREAETEIGRLQMKIDKNKILEEQMEYAKAAYLKFKQTYDFEEAKTREKLESQINELFKQIYAGGITIKIDEKYRITSYVNEFEEYTKNLDYNTAKIYSIIFAFIVGVINLAKQKTAEKSNYTSIITDEYPLVMDAPLSSFDQRRIKNICEVIPNIARQVVIFIKDVDGNIAKQEMIDKIGIEYEVSLIDKENPLESKIMKVGEN
ncbi:MAG: AAA family ATPase [Clostridia bacterium]|nr:AAA family ATPase [Clostridia bacterium]